LLTELCLRHARHSYLTMVPLAILTIWQSLSMHLTRQAQWLQSQPLHLQQYYYPGAQMSIKKAHSVKYYRMRRKSGSDQGLLVDHQLEMQAQFFRSLAAKKHAAHEDLKIIHHRTVFGVYVQLQKDLCFFFVDGKGCFPGRVIDSVVDVEGCDVLIAHPCAAYIRFVCQDHGSGHGIDRCLRRGFQWR